LLKPRASYLLRNHNPGDKIIYWPYWFSSQTWTAGMFVQRLYNTTRNLITIG